MNYILTGGVVANIFLIAANHDIGEPSTEFVKNNIPDYKNVIKHAKKMIKKYGEKIVYPSDVATNDNGKRIGVAIDQLPTKNPIHDIGIDTLVKYINLISEAGTIIANGPMGVFENPEFAIGTREIFQAIANSEGMTVVGGGETAMAFNQMGLALSLIHI